MSSSERVRNNVLASVGGVAIGAIGGSAAFIYSESAYIEHPSDGWKIVGALCPVIGGLIGLASSELGRRRTARRERRILRRTNR